MNDERSLYRDRADYLAEDADPEPNEIDRLVAAPNQYEARAYPNTPVSFYSVFAGPSLVHLERLCGACEGQQ